MLNGGGLPCVFVVDDETVIATTLAAILRLQGFQAHSFDLPLKALRFARETAPDLLLTDVMMPQLSGIELAIRIREFCPNCKVLLFSGQATTANLLAGPHASGYDFKLLTKPVHPSDLIARVRVELGV